MEVKLLFCRSFFVVLNEALEVRNLGVQPLTRFSELFDFGFEVLVITYQCFGQVRKIGFEVTSLLFE